MSRHQSAEICNGRIRSSRSKHREVARDAKNRCVAVYQVTIQYSNQVWKVQTERTHTISSTETSSQSELRTSFGQNSRQVLIEHHEEIFGKPHKKEHMGICSGWLRPCREDGMCTEASCSYTATKCISKGSSCTVGIAHECRTKNPSAEKGRVLFQQR